MIWNKIKEIYEDLVDSVKYNGFAKGIYYSELFSPIYNLIGLPKRIYNYVDKFIYYGKAGTKTYDFDANSVDVLIYAQVKRVRKFMDSDKTHLMWNSDRKKGLIRKLYELEELCKRKQKNGDFNDFYYARKVHKKYKRGDIAFFDMLDKVNGYREDIRKAYKKDGKIAQSRKKRYDELLSKYLEMFWD